MSVCRYSSKESSSSDCSSCETDFFDFFDVLPDLDTTLFFHNSVKKSGCLEKL